jgi:hypothetical protein
VKVTNDPQRKRGGQLGNTNAAGSRKSDKAKNVTFKLYRYQIDLLEKIVQSQGTNASHEVRVAIEEWAIELGIITRDT